MREHFRRVEHDEFMQAQIAEKAVNYGMCRPKEPVGIDELMPSRYGKRPAPKRRRWQSRKQIAENTRNVMEHFRRHFGGSDPDRGA